MSVPGFALRAALGELAARVLGDMFATANRLIAEDFVFDGTDEESTLRFAPGRRAASTA